LLTLATTPARELQAYTNIFYGRGGSRRGLQLGSLINLCTSASEWRAGGED
jgi:hypothetical protein